MRRQPTIAEAKLWKHLRGRQLEGAKFSRQIAIGPFIADFVCRERKLVIELDGSKHGDEADRARHAWIEAQGYKVLRFWNIDVFKNIDGVLFTISSWLRGPSPSGPLPEVGWGVAASAPPPTSGRGLGGGGQNSEFGVEAPTPNSFQKWEGSKVSEPA